MKLICFPYAGGSSLIYNKWKRYIGPEIQIRPVELAGRGKRSRDRFYDHFDDLVDDVVSIIGDEIKSDDYAFFGHSLGSKISYEVTSSIINLSLPPPRHVFFSGNGAPYTHGISEKKFDNLSDDEFKKEILTLGGTPPEVFQSPELLDFFLPLLRSDFKMAKRVVEGKQINPLDTDITVFLGKTDDFSADQVVDWKLYTRKTCSIHYLNGGHFFIQELNQLQYVIGCIRNTLKQFDFSTSQ